MNRIAALTIVNANYIHFALNLSSSYLINNPEHDFYIFLLDDVVQDIRDLADSRVKFLEVDEKSFENLKNRRFYYDIVEYSTSVKPECILYLLDRGYEKVYYVDPDIQIYDSFQELDQLLEHNHFILTPHSTVPIYDGELPDDLTFLRVGSYNLGFLGVDNSDESVRMLQWWKERLSVNAFNALSMGMFTDQKWGDLFPSYFAGVYINRSPRYNVSHWNMHSREIDKKFESYVVNGERLVFFHFSGLPLEGDAVSKYTDRFGSYRHLGIYTELLFENYKRDIRSIRERIKREKFYRYDLFVDGELIKPLDRMLFFHFIISGGDMGDPFNLTRKQFYNYLENSLDINGVEFTKDRRIDKIAGILASLPAFLRNPAKKIVIQPRVSEVLGGINNGINKVNITNLIFPLFKDQSVHLNSKDQSP